MCKFIVLGEETLCFETLICSRMQFTLCGPLPLSHYLQSIPSSTSNERVPTVSSSAQSVRPLQGLRALFWSTLLYFLQGVPGDFQMLLLFYSHTTGISRDCLLFSNSQISQPFLFFFCHTVRARVVSTETRSIPGMNLGSMVQVHPSLKFSILKKAQWFRLMHVLALSCDFPEHSLSDSAPCS